MAGKHRARGRFRLRGKTTKASNAGSFRTTERNEADVALTVAAATPAVTENQPAPRARFEGGTTTVAGASGTTTQAPDPTNGSPLAGHGFTPVNATARPGAQRPALSRLLLGDLGRDLRAIGGSMSNDLATSVDVALPGRALNIRLGMSQQRLAAARSQFAQAQALPFSDPERQRRMATAAAEMRAAEHEARELQREADRRAGLAPDDAENPGDPQRSTSPTRARTRRSATAPIDDAPGADGRRYGAYWEAENARLARGDEPDLITVAPIAARDLVEGDLVNLASSDGTHTVGVVAFDPDETTEGTRRDVTICFADGTFDRYDVDATFTFEVWPTDEQDMDNEPGERTLAS